MLRNNENELIDYFTLFSAYDLLINNHIDVDDDVDIIMAQA